MSAPNLMSLSRIPLGVFAAIALGWPDPAGSLVSLTACVAAGLTDWLDGYLARSGNEITSLGLILDPLADKLFAAILAIGLVLTREFPIWLMAIIVGRDLLIVLAAAVIGRRSKIRVPSNLTGKYAFAAIMVLVASAIIRYRFGVELLSVVSLLLILLSLVSYARLFLFVQRNGRLPAETDRPALKKVRIGLTVAVSVIFLIGLYQQFWAGQPWR